MEHSRSVVKSNEVIGVKVINTARESLGKIEEIILDKQAGKVRYVVLSYGGFLGMGDKYFAVPWEILKYDPTEDAFVVNLSKEKLENGEGFDKNSWPDVADPTWGSNIYKYYDTKPYWE